MKRLYLVIPLAAVFVLFASAIPAAAQYGQRVTELGPYVTLKGGGYFPETGDLENFDNAFYGEVAVGGRIHPIFGLELGVGWFETEDTGQEVQVVPIMLNAKVPIPLGPVNPYVLGGIGGYWVDLEVGPESEDDFTYGFQAGAGIDFEVTPMTFLGVEGKYIWTEPELGNTDVEVSGFVVTGNVGFRF